MDLYVNGEVISTTEEHPFWVPDKGWVEAGDLQVGDLFQTKDGVIIDLDGIERREGEFEVYNFEVEDFHTYFVSDLEILVHNACAGGDGPADADWDDFFKEMDSYQPSEDARKIADHMWDKHRTDVSEFQDQERLAEYIDNMITNPLEPPRIRQSDRTKSYWDEQNKRIIIHNPNHLEGGTVFRPDGGREFFEAFGDPDPNY